MKAQNSYASMKTRILMIPCALLMLMAEGCAAFEKPDFVKTWFWSRKYNTDMQIEAVLNDSIHCEVMYSNETMSCDNIHNFEALRPVLLKEGNYKIRVKTNDGKIISAGTMQLSVDNMTLKGESGGLDARQTDDCLVIEVL